MLGEDRRGLRCPRAEGVVCPVRPCLGADDPGACRHLAALEGWRSLRIEDQRSRIVTGDPGFTPASEPPPGRLRVGLWCPCLGLGGAEVWQIALARGVNPARICWMGAAVVEGRGAAHAGMERELASIMPVGHGLDAARTLASACDVVVSWVVADVSAIVSGLARPPAVVMACHFPGESPWGEGSDVLLGGVNRFVAVSDLALESVPRSLRDRVEVIWNAVDPGRLAVGRCRSTMRSRWGVPPDVPVAGYIGRLAPEKDPDAMLRLAAELPEPWHVVVVGEGREREALARKVNVLGLDRARLVGGDTSVGDVLGAFDALVVPSLYESFGLTMAEGLWAGVPVLATRSGLAKLVPGLVREIRAGAGGRELAEAVLADRRDAEGTRLRVERAGSFARDRLGIERFGRAWTELLLQAAAREGGPAMLGDEPGRVTCPRTEGLACPSTPCPGLSDPGVCSHLAALSTWRRMSSEEQIGRLGKPRPAIDPAVRDAVNACPDRGPVLPISLQDDCGCRGKELSECRAGRGATPGRVTLRDCLTCQGRVH